MADKILMNKNTLAALKLELKGYHTALPVFEMKEQQLKEIIQGIEHAVIKLKAEMLETEQEVKTWAAVIAENSLDLSDLVTINEFTTQTREIAGCY